MRFVRPEQVSGERRCAITGRTQDPEGFIHTGRVLSGWDPEVSISAGAAKEIARIIGWVSPEAIEIYLERLRRLQEDFNEAKAQLDKLSQLKEFEEELEVSA